MQRHGAPSERSVSRISASVPFKENRHRSPSVRFISIPSHNGSAMTSPETPTAAHANERWPSLRPLILEEWPGLDGAALDATGGAFDAVLTLIVAHTDHTRLRVRRHLEELIELAAPHRQGLEARLLDLLDRLDAGSEPLQAKASEAAEAAREVLHDVEGRAGDLARDAKAQLPLAEAHMRDNLWSTVFGALGIGLIFGLLWGTSRGR
jgi:ElaB/YqjD/DUF883 family membrane-anchored ribosome-binding protein